MKKAILGSVAAWAFALSAVSFSACGEGNASYSSSADAINLDKVNYNAELDSCEQDSACREMLAESGTDTLCLGNDAAAPLFEDSLAAGSYAVIHDCEGDSWLYRCSGVVVYGGDTLACGAERDGLPISTLPASGSILTVSAGSVLEKLGCDRRSGNASCPVTGVLE